MLLQRETSFLLVIDIQEKLAPAIHQGQQVIERNSWLLSIASELDLPIVVTEQYPQGLGHTVATLQPLIANASVVQKTYFSGYAEPPVTASLQALKRPQVVITGTEAHVCVLQTAIDRQTAGFQVYVVADAVGSRHPDNKNLALQRMQGAGCQLVSSEMVAFEWLKRSATDEFRHISKTYLR